MQQNARGAYGAPTDPVVGFRGHFAAEREGRERKGRGWDGEGTRGADREG